MNHLSQLWRALALLLAACAAPAITTDQQEQLTQAQRQMKSDPDAALAITDQLLGARPDWHDARVLSAEGSLLLSRQGRKNTQELLADAAKNYERALAQKPEDPPAWIGLAEARYGLGDYEGARTAADEAVARLSKTEGKNRSEAQKEQLGQAAMIAARSQYQVFVAERKHEVETGKPEANGFVKPDRHTLDAAQQALSLLQASKRSDPGESFTLSASIYQWLNQNVESLKELENGIRAAPSSAQLHSAYQEMYRSMGDYRSLAAAYAHLVKEQPGQPSLVWYQGLAFVVQADNQREKGSFRPAVETYKKALECYAQFHAMAPGNATAAEWRAICELSLARTSVMAGDLEGAKTHLFAAPQLSPKAVAYDGDKPQMIDSFGSHFASIVTAISMAMRESGQDGMRKSIVFAKEVFQRWPGKWAFMYSDAALTARDLGVGLEKQTSAEGVDAAGRERGMKEAMQLWEQSYAWYQQAVKLSPDDARTANDCGLMLVYHLHRDYDQARKLFDRAIANGDKQLAALTAEATTQQRQAVEEAIGDAWQNIGKLLLLQHRPWAEAKPFCEKAVQYYPGQQREAAALLRNDGLDESAQDGEKAQAFGKVKQAAEASVKNGDLDGALSGMDAAAKELKDYAPFCALRADLALRFAVQRRDEGQTKGLDFLFQDALKYSQRAVELDSTPTAPRLVLARALYENLEFADAAKTASELLLHLQSQGGGNPADVAAAHRMRAQAGAQAYAAARAAGSDLPAILPDVWASFRYLEQQKQLDDQAMLAALTDTAINANQPALAVEMLGKRTDPAGLWFLGKARFWSANELYTGGKHAEAQAELDAAKQAFEKAKAANPAFADSSNQYLAMVLGKKGCVAFAAGKYDDAEKWLIESARMSPERAGESLGGADTTVRGILLVADHYAKSDPAHVVRIYRQSLSDYADDKWLDILNNLGLFARDYGNALERKATKDDAEAVKQQAMKLYEESYAAYSKAQPLDPTNVRLRNDRALMLIYHLHRDWDLAKELLDTAIADGERQLKENPPEHAQAKLDLEEAIGDCYENLALWQLEHGKNGAAAKAAALRSMDYHPGKSRGGAQRHLHAAEALLQKGE
jgi:tetratricopeptide (TPR) repeat protein